MLKDDGYLLDMLNEAKKLAARFSESSRNDLGQDEIKRDAALWSLTVIGEAAGKISRSFRDQHEEIPWREIIGLRNVLVHNYAEIDLDIVWAIISHSVPPLISALEAVVPREDDL